MTVTAVKGDMVTIDGNHPLAGQDLNFAVEITEGIKDQDKVVVAGTNHLSDKSALKIAPAVGKPSSPPAEKGG